MFSLSPLIAAYNSSVTTKYSYDVDGQLIQVDKGTSSPPSGSGFTAQETATFAYDAAGNEIRQTVFDGGSTTQPKLSLTQLNYDADDRPLCTAARNNAAVFGSLPAACVQSAPGPDGPDHIGKLVYDAAGQKTQEVRGIGTAEQEAYATYVYSQNGKVTRIKDANVNLTALTYDGFDRLSRMNFPSTTLGAGTFDPNDFEAYSYDANGNRLIFTRRDGNTITASYDALSTQSRNVPRFPQVGMSPGWRSVLGG
ncbi:MAG: hypothetical protein H0X27_07360, partial [Caulobacteraceae bacterium]|nr:hypothetical protein [Caulobacteraceae bacterium]